MENKIQIKQLNKHSNFNGNGNDSYWYELCLSKPVEGYYTGSPLIKKLEDVLEEHVNPPSKLRFEEFLEYVYKVRWMLGRETYKDMTSITIELSLEKYISALKDVQEYFDKNLIPFSKQSFRLQVALQEQVTVHHNGINIIIKLKK